MTRFVLLAVLLTAVSAAALCGPALDEIMDVMKLDQTAPHRDMDATITVSSASPIGVSFTTGPRAKKLCRIAIGWGPTGESWASDESLVLTVWDSEKKRARIAEYAMPYKFRSWEGATVMFPLWVAVKPDSRYYFELTVTGGNGSIDGVQMSKTGCASATMYVGGSARQDCIWFETHAKGDFDRDAAYAAQFANWDMDYPGLEKVKAAVQGKDWDTACRELVAWYEGQERFLPKAARSPAPDPKFDPRLPDLAARQQWEDLDNNVVEIGPDWNYYAWWGKRGGVGLTRSGLMQPLSGGYRNTRDEKYAKAYNDMMLAMCRDEPSPLKSGIVKPGSEDIPSTFNTGIGGGSMWSALSIGPRANQALYWYGWFVDSPSFTQDARCAVIFSMADMVNVLAMMKGGGNWETQIKSALFGFADDHREFAQWKKWFNHGKDGLFENLAKALQPDGSLEESSPNYQALSVNRFLSVLEKCKGLGFEVPKRSRWLTERGIEWLMFITQGNGVIPSWGDTWQPMRCNLFTRGADYFGRDDFRWFAENGKQGHEPLQQSKAFPYGGWYVMRSGWGPDDLFLMTHNGPYPGHGHNDRLAIVAYAYGRELLIDPGIFSYGTREAAELSRSRSHSTVTVDGLDTVKRGTANLMAITPGFDYYSGTNAGYIKGGDERHTRRIVFVKPSYWLIHDTVTGSGSHEVESRFQFPQCETEFAGLTARSAERSGANIQVSMVGDTGFTLTRDTGNICLKEHLYPIPVARFSKKAQLPVSFTTLLYPYPGGKACDGQAEALELDQNAAGCSAAAVRTPGRTDYVLFGQPGGLVSAARQKLAVDGDALVVRWAGSSLESVFLANGTVASVNGTRYVSADKPCSVSVTYTGDTVRIDADKPELSLQVFTGRAAFCSVNSGARFPVKPGALIKPFSAPQ